jgi:RNA polymerase sigma-70 factor (ECF subfamily)
VTSEASLSAADLPDLGTRLSARERARRLRRLVDAHWQLAARLLRNMGVPEGELDDGVQQAFLVVSDKLEAIRAGAERAFLAQTAVHIAARYRRAAGRSREVPTEQPEAPDPAASPEDLVDRGRAMRWLDRVLDEMSLDLRSVFVLYEVEEMTMAEIAAALDLPPGTVASRLRRAREEFHERARDLRAPRREGMP